jgi:hypothetical protein
MAKRNPSGGFVLLDALVAFALVALVLTAVYLVLPATASRQIERLNRLHRTEFAVSILEEHRVTFPVMASQGRDPSGWTWSIVEREVEPDPLGAMAPLISYHEVTVTVWHEGRPDDRQSHTTVVARRRT